MFIFVTNIHIIHSCVSRLQISCGLTSSSITPSIALGKKVSSLIGSPTLCLADPINRLVNPLGANLDAFKSAVTKSITTDKDRTQPAIVELYDLIQRSTGFTYCLVEQTVLPATQQTLCSAGAPTEAGNALISSIRDNLRIAEKLTNNLARNKSFDIKTVTKVAATAKTEWVCQ